MKKLKFAILACMLFASTCYAQLELSNGRDFLTQPVTEQPYQEYGETSTDYSRWTVFAFNVPQPVVSIEIHCHSEMQEKIYVNGVSGERVGTFICKGAAMVGH
jgi:hypothetical protein